MTPAAAQKLADLHGGCRERYAPVAMVTLSDGCPNIAAAYAADGTYLFDFAWRPFERDKDVTAGLFFC